MEKYFKSPETLKTSIERDASRPGGAAPVEQDIEVGGKAVLDCFEKNVLSITNKYPETKFILFNPPVLQQVQWARAQLGFIDAWNRAQDLLAERIKKS